jgi:hypothetical protein
MGPYESQVRETKSWHIPKMVLSVTVLLSLHYVHLPHSNHLFTLKTEAAGSSETLVPLYQTISHPIPEDHNLNTDHD